MALYGHCPVRGRISVEKEQPQVVQKSRRDEMVDNDNARLPPYRPKPGRQRLLRHGNLAVSIPTNDGASC